MLLGARVPDLGDSAGVLVVHSPSAIIVRKPDGLIEFGFGSLHLAQYLIVTAHSSTERRARLTQTSFDPEIVVEVSKWLGHDAVPLRRCSQVSHDARKLADRLDYGRNLDEDQFLRDGQLETGIARLVAKAHEWLARQPLRINCDRQSSPSTWITEILAKARGRSGGKVEQHLVGAKLTTRHPGIDIPNFPSHAGDAQTRRSGDFPLDRISYHVTATDGKEAIPRCKENVETGIHPILIVPRTQVAKALWRAESEGISDRISVLAMEDFITQNIIELSIEKGQDFFTTLQDIVSEYNRRLEAVETDLSLKIEVR